MGFPVESQNTAGSSHIWTEGVAEATAGMEAGAELATVPFGTDPPIRCGAADAPAPRANAAVKISCGYMIDSKALIIKDVLRRLTLLCLQSRLPRKRNRLYKEKD